MKKKFKLGLKKKKATPLPEAEGLFDIEEGLFDIEEEKSHGRSGKKQMTVVLEYDPARLTGYSSLLMECIASRGIISEDFDVEKATKWVKALGDLSAKTLAADEDRWQLFIFSFEYLRLHGTDEERREASLSDRKVNPDWDETKENIKQEGRTIGGVDEGGQPPIIPVQGDFGVGHVEGLFDIEADIVPIREQVKKKQKEVIDNARPHSAPAEKDEGRKDGERPDIRIWEMAQELAHKDRSEWEGKVDKILELKAKYCYKWLQEFGTDAPQPSVVDLFWTKDVFSSEMNKDKLSRKQQITSQVVRYLQKAVAKRGDTVDMTLKSYRTVLTAMYLDTAINKYVIAGSKHTIITTGSGGTRTTPDDSAEMEEVKKAAKDYFKAHRPIETVGSPPGPLSTLDPEYPEYLRICRQYKLPVGTLLHEVKL